MEGSRQIKRSMQDLYLIVSFDKFGYKVESSSLEKQVVQGKREISICCAKMQGEFGLRHREVRVPAQKAARHGAAHPAHLHTALRAAIRLDCTLS